ncbi:hypothetical protein CSKR_107463 [Clonorchis sinensis]|uniref:Uncharacterized protein n=1 Tax=Clonorchis sinensis TaxID=79923 RepID=A0A3R7JRW0_CLOSI|nr:hypothetical protein CSKR_107463 [Clonorchis sinensis]
MVATKLFEFAGYRKNAKTEQFRTQNTELEGEIQAAISPIPFMFTLLNLEEMAIINQSTFARIRHNVILESMENLSLDAFLRLMRENISFHGMESTKLRVWILPK